MSDFKKLKVWRKAHALALNVHRVAIRIRGADHASLRNQLIRAGGSIPTNLVEGSAQETGKQFARFITISINSTSELEYHLIVGRDYEAIPASDFKSLIEQTIEVRKMLYGLRNSVLVLPRKPPK
ncbi:MAG TPA: four helix bundle protein [Gemmatimonadaceae bacterium]|nr:four helix bundle protein [Gemmatimonadaceae bacterium]